VARSSFGVHTTYLTTRFDIDCGLHRLTWCFDWLTVLRDGYYEYSTPEPFALSGKWRGRTGTKKYTPEHMSLKYLYTELRTSQSPRVWLS
jgi:hypothetical protein